MKIRYSLNRLDLFKARIAIVLSNRTILVFLLAIGGLVFYATLTSKAAPTHSLNFRILSATIQLMFVYGMTLGMLVLMSFIQAFTGKEKGVIGEHTLRITDEGLEEATEYNLSLHRWSAFGKRKKRGGLMLIYVTDRMAHIVPVRRPLLEGDLPEFLRCIDENTKKAFRSPQTTPAHRSSVSDR
jgi:hypothetical protein